MQYSLTISDLNLVITIYNSLDGSTNFVIIPLLAAGHAYTLSESWYAENNPVTGYYTLQFGNCFFNQIDIAPDGLFGNATSDFMTDIAAISSAINSGNDLPGATGSIGGLPMMNIFLLADSPYTLTCSPAGGVWQVDCLPTFATIDPATGILTVISVGAPAFTVSYTVGLSSSQVAGCVTA